MDKLTEARSVINRVDEEMAKLFTERMNAAAVVAAYKKEHGLPILDASREAEIIEKGVARIGDEALKEHYVTFLKSMMSISKSYQRELLEGMPVAYSGTEGAFAHIAAGKVFPGAERIGYADFASAYRAVDRKSVV